MAETNFTGRLLAAMRSMGNPPLDSEGKVRTKSGYEYTYRYASLKSILGVVRPALLDQGIILRQGLTAHEAAHVKGGVYFILETGVQDSETKEYYTLDERLVYLNDNAQTFGSYETYMRRYALNTAFGLVGDADDDGAATVTPEEAEKAHGDAMEAGQALADAINIYCVVTNSDPSQVRATIKRKLAQTGEGGNPEALKREAENLHQAVRALKPGAE